MSALSLEIGDCFMRHPARLLLLISAAGLVCLSAMAGQDRASPEPEVAFQKDGIITIYLDPQKIERPHAIDHVRCELFDEQQQTWKAVGNFELTRERGRVTGKFVYVARAEGIYRFRSIGLSRRNEAEDKHAAAEVVVLVDATPPVVTLAEDTLRPKYPEQDKIPQTLYEFGQTFKMTWAATDEASRIQPWAWVSVSFDGGDTWPARYRRKRVELESPTGRGLFVYHWVVPTRQELEEYFPGRKEALKRIDVVALRVEVSDRAGNTGFALTRMFSIGEPGAGQYPQTGTVVADGKPIVPPEDRPPPPENAEINAHFQRGLIYLFREDYDEAAEEFEGALAIQPGYVPALSNLAIAEFFDGRREKALDRLQFALAARTFRGDVQLTVTYAWLLLERSQKGDAKQAWVQLQHMLPTGPRTPREVRLHIKAKALLAGIAEGLGRFDVARLLWLEIYNKAPTDSPLRQRAQEFLRR